METTKQDNTAAQQIGMRLKLLRTEQRLSRLLHFISAIIIKEDVDGNNYGPHEVRDYCIEIINIDNGIATISIGS